VPLTPATIVAMATITIDGKDCDFKPGQMILQVATEHGIEIPHYCYHDGLSITASCRICLIEVWAPNPRNENKLEPIPKLLPACQTPAGEGQVVYLDSPKVLANQKQVMEYLLINHPLDCPICDQAGECHLQDYSYRYGRSESRFIEDKNKQPKKDLGENVYLYSDRCILCTRCVRFTREITGTSELAVVGRGSTEQIDLFPGVALDNELSGCVVDVCPVGAMLDKDFQFSQRVWNLTATPGIDGLTAGGDNISIEHHDGRIYRVKPRTNMNVNCWWISDEVRYGWKFVHSDDRLTEPRRLQSGENKLTTFESAYRDIDTAMRKAAANGQTVAALVSPMLPCEEAYLIADYLNQFFPESGRVILGVGPVPMEGEDKTFPPGAEANDPKSYTIRAEKAPNVRGVRRVLNAFAEKQSHGAPVGFEEFLEAVKPAEVVIITGNYPKDWVTKDLTKALAKKFVILIDTLPNALGKKANITLPGATWTEKAGTFENVDGRLQTFEQSIKPIDFARSEARIFTELIALAEQGGTEVVSMATPINTTEIRQRIADEIGLSEFVSEAHEPVEAREVEADMQFVEL